MGPRTHLRLEGPEPETNAEQVFRPCPEPREPQPPQTTVTRHGRAATSVCLALRGTRAWGCLPPTSLRPKFQALLLRLRTAAPPGREAPHSPPWHGSHTRLPGGPHGTTGIPLGTTDEGGVPEHQPQDKDRDLKTRGAEVCPTPLCPPCTQKSKRPPSPQSPPHQQLPWGGAGGGQTWHGRPGEGLARSV